MEKYFDLADKVRRILIARDKTGATIDDIKADYVRIVGETFPSCDMIAYMLSIPSVICLVGGDGTLYFKLNFDESTTCLFEELKYQEQNEVSQQNKNVFVSNCVQDDNQRAQLNHFWNKGNKENSNFGEWGSLPFVPTMDPYSARFLEYLLLGDDFFLSMTKMHSGGKYRTIKNTFQCGLCVSGQTISDAIIRIKNLPNHFCNVGIIVNIGSVDIMKRKPIYQIINDYRDLVDAIFKKGLRMILTTIAPLANHMYDQRSKRAVMHFNECIKSKGTSLQVVDIWSAMINKNGQFISHYYEKGETLVVGTKEPLVLWSDAGCQHVQQTLELQLGL